MLNMSVPCVEGRISACHTRTSGAPPHRTMSCSSVTSCAICALSLTKPWIAKRRGSVFARMNHYKLQLVEARAAAAPSLRNDSACIYEQTEVLYQHYNETAGA